MSVDYDSGLVFLSILIATVASYCGFHLAARLLSARGLRRKLLLAAAAVTIGGGIWSMHFVAMLALALPVLVSYDLLGTLISALVAILATGVALTIAVDRPRSLLRTVGGGCFMGLGIVAMHYIGMSAIRGNCTVSHYPPLVAASVVVAIAAATLAIVALFRLRGRFHKIWAAIVLGLAVSGMHYTAMAGASFYPLDGTVEFAAPALSQPLLAIVVAIVTFMIVGFTMLAVLPDMPRIDLASGGAAQPEPAFAGTGASGRSFPDAPQPAAARRLLASAELSGPLPRDEVILSREGREPLQRLPVLRNRTTMLLDLDDIISIDANAHYTTVHGQGASYFCSLSVSELEARLDPARFLRVHRSHIVNIRHAAGFTRRNDHGVILLDCAERREVPVARGKIPKLREALGI
jgi:NO-binding membrane sensor protein with MHYT domain